MKKLFLTCLVIFLLSVNSFAGWIHSPGFACDPATSPPGTCIYVDDRIFNQQNPIKDESVSSVLIVIKFFVTGGTPLGFLFN